MSVLAVAAAIVFYAVFLYNRFVRLKNRCDEGWSGVTVQLKRRRDLIPNLVECVKGYAKHEQSTLENVIELRNAAMNASAPADVAKAESNLSQGVKSLFALGESYPELKAGANFAKLQESLEKIEDDLQNARRYYNATARDLNTAIDTFPSNLIAKNFGFAKREFFDIDDREKENVAVSF
ncbi:MAG TPA: hypothetical protein DCX19_05440 [Alphaproteobacteria bacterium]|nr:hypothetical protein [Alphaproteobacteria bacterium]